MDKPTGSYNTYKQETKDYASYIRSLDDPKRIMAHLYTWHMGDLFGGQMIKKIVDAPHTHLDFEDPKTLMTNMRSMLSDDMGDEANTAFDWAIRIMESYDSSLEQN
jgi:heme oxygenase